MTIDSHWVQTFFFTISFAVTAGLSFFHLRRLKKLHQTDLLLMEQRLESAYQLVDAYNKNDRLTNTLKKENIEKKIQEEHQRFLRSNEPFSIIKIAIDNYPSLTEEWGSDLGEYFISSVAQKIKQTIRIQDTLGRWGESEFVLVLPNTENHGARFLAKKIRTMVNSHQHNIRLKSSNKTISLNISQGIAECNDAKKSTSLLLSETDLCLFQGKRSGVNKVISLTLSKTPLNASLH